MRTKRNKQISSTSDCMELAAAIREIVPAAQMLAEELRRRALLRSLRRISQSRCKAVSSDE